MGTWGDRLWDNDSALDQLPALIDAKIGGDLHRMLAVWALKLWFERCTVEEFNRAISRRSKDVIKLPKPLFEQLAAMIARPKELADKSDRSNEHQAVIGGYCAGLRLDVIFAMPEARPVLAEIAAKLKVLLDGYERANGDFYELGFVELGVALELTRCEIWPAPADVERWRAAFNAADQRTTQERSFFDDFVKSVGPAFDLLARPSGRDGIIRHLGYFALAPDPKPAAEYAARTIEASLGVDRASVRVAVDAALSDSQTDATRRTFFALVSGALS